MDLIRLDGTNTEKAAKMAAKALKAGGIVAYPTDTLYGLGVNPFDPDAVERLRLLKGRERKKPISVIVPDVNHIHECAVMNDTARALAERFLPGPLTLVMPMKSMPPEITLNESVGIRIPNDEFCLALAKAFGHPYTTTSANKAGEGVPRDVENLMEHFRFDLDKIALIVDGGPRLSPDPSTVVSCVGETPYVLREGALKREQLGL